MSGFKVRVKAIFRLVQIALIKRIRFNDTFLNVICKSVHTNTQRLPLPQKFQVKNFKDTIVILVESLRKSEQIITAVVSLTLIRVFLGPSPSVISGKKIQNHCW